MSMPSARNRIYGVQLYKYKIIEYYIGDIIFITASIPLNTLIHMK